MNAEPDNAPAPALPERTVWLLLAGYIGAVLLNLHHTALWCLPVALAAAGWRARALRRRLRAPARGWRIGVVVLLTAAVLISFHTLNGLAAGASLLVAMAALKLLETARERDWMIIIGASLFLLLAACLDAPSLWRMPLYGLELWLICTAVYALGGGPSAPPTPLLARRAGHALLAAVPFAVVLFLFFPRLPGSFWALPKDDQAVMGLGDEMSPGSITSLSESDDPAARVRFDGPLPPPDQRYFRGPVLHEFDGYTWRRRRMEAGPRPRLQYHGDSYSYEVTLEPSQTNVLIALELPLSLPDSLPVVFSTFDHQLLVPQPNEHAISYRLQSVTQITETDGLPDTQRRLDLQLPPGRNPRSVELAHSLRAEAASDGAYVDRLLAYLKRGGFSYTLTPSLLNRDSVDDLLFRTHEGFCGHYASAFVMLLRAGGVPARVVTGYLGGQWNRFGGYLLLRQSDAHAWAEVWLQGQGWVRIDPTAVVAPGRLTRDLDTLLPAAGRVLRGRAPAWLSTPLQAWQAMNAWWQDEFIGFNFDKQLSILSGLGFKDHYRRALTALVSLSLSAWLAFVTWSLRSRRAAPAEDQLRRSWRRLERKLRPAAMPRASHEGVIAYAERVGRLRPELAAPLRALARRYSRLRYGARASQRELRQFARAVRLLRLAPRTTPG